MVMNLHGKHVALDNLLTDISIDIETLGTNPDSVILQIGIVGFNPETGEIGPKINTNIDLDLSIKEGFSFAADTFYWWLKQGRAGATLEDNRYHPNMVCTQVEKYIHTYTVGPDNVRVWGNGAAFDNVIVKNHFQKYGIELPWKFWNDRCARTLFALNPNIPRVKPKIAHVAGYDAVAQAETIMAILRENKRTVSGIYDETFDYKILDDCPHKSHSGGFEQVMYKPTCSRKNNKLLGYVETTQRLGRAVAIVAKYDGVIPDWCPLEDYR